MCKGLLAGVVFTQKIVIQRRPGQGVLRTVDFILREMHRNPSEGFKQRMFLKIMLAVVKIIFWMFWDGGKG